nr:unnamed protein product [Callosobruchus analis]CAI5858461.1 unnamed protein product [Callosobruchus analis]
MMYYSVLGLLVLMEAPVVLKE